MSTAHSNSRTKILFLVQFSLLLAIEAIVSFTPLGSLPSFVPIVATLSHVPVILTAVILGTAAGTAMGFMFGLFSFLVWTFSPPSPITAFVFTPFYTLGEMKGGFASILICFVPRILVGFVTGIVFTFLRKALVNRKSLNVLSYGISGFLGSLTNTLLVLGGIYIFFGKEYASAFGIEYTLLLGALSTVIFTSGISEAVIGAVLAYTVGVPVKRLVDKGR
ncbi:MAG TPA: ECF transporter S component [Clostridia bacterium]|nr:ECF transporter S component [Clostridia bacterium]